MRKFVLEYIVTAAVIMILAFTIYGFHPIERWRYRHIPGPPTRWLLGGLPEISKLSLHKAYEQWAQQYAKDGIFKVFWGGRAHVVVVEPSLTQRMLTSSPDRFSPLVVGNELDRLFAENQMLFLNGSEWKERRALFNQFLINPSKLETYFPSMLRSVDRFVEHLDAHADSGDPVELWSSFGSLTLDVILTVASGLEVNTLDKLVGSASASSSFSSNDNNTNQRAASMEETHQSLGAILAEKMRADIDSFKVESGMAMLYLFPQMRWLAELTERHAVSEKGKQGFEARRAMTEIFYKLVDAARQAAVVAANGVGGGGANIKDKDKDGASELLHINPESFLASVATVKDSETGELKPKIWAAIQTYLFCIAGYETTANSLAYTVHLLALNPDKQARLIQEIDEKFGKNRIPSTAAEVQQQLPYLHACLMESLRLLGPAPLAVRLAQHDMVLGGYHIPKGTWMQNMSWVTHRAPEYWERSLDYLPERWLLGDDSKAVAGGGMPPADPKAHFPFGSGARKCPGYRLALLEAQLTLLRVYQRFSFTIPPGTEELKLRTEITLTPRENGGVLAMVDRRRDGGDGLNE